MKLKIPNTSSVSFWLIASLLISFALEVLVQMKVIRDVPILKMGQYLLLLFPISLAFLQVIFQRYNRENSIEQIPNLKFKNELKLGLLLGLIFLVLTLLRSYSEGIFSANSILEVFQITFPFIFSFVIVNFVSQKGITNFMKFSLIIVLIGLLFDERENLVVISNYLKISIFDSYSPFENNTFPQFAAPLGVYFVYHMRKYPFMAALALIVNFLIFKRVLLLMVIVLFIFRFFHLDKRFWKLGRYTKTYATLWFCIILLTYHMYLPENRVYYEQLLDVNFARFTVGRIYRFWYVNEQGFQSYGLGSTREFLFQKNLSYVGYDFEMDFIKTFFEIGPIAVASYVFVMLKSCGKNIYAVLAVQLYFLNYLMANGMYQYWSVSLLLLSIACISNDEENLKYKQYMDKKIVKFRIV
ncbi:hypothetical protein NOL38_04500 [Streptococcus suis]|uniref:hypothetical protein n=1 Tax=Streptococcus suis TaxID=1307 RepID=UPI002412C8FF|nr:hypothetical protein [Streptococcus suis]MDG4505523.1 hypothetical protein [Streptococcus suis]QCO71406.1 Wzy [Streptococcus suis]HEM4403743.1 hypothetical protein [Streptococcus suis]